MARVSMPASDSGWRAKMDLETLLEAERIKKDPKRYKAVQKCAKERKAEIVNDIGALAEMAESDKDGDE